MYRSVFIPWTHGESDPDLFHAMEPFYRYTMGPSVAKKSKIIIQWIETIRNYASVVSAKGGSILRVATDDNTQRPRSSTDRIGPS